MQFKAIQIHGRPLAGGERPAVCCPLVGRDAAQLAAEAAAAAAHGPDLLEWRVDFFAAIADTAAVLQAADAIRAAAPGLPLLFTRRSHREGGQPVPLSEDGVLALYRDVCAARKAELVDWEMAGDPAHVEQVRGFARSAGIVLVLSHHNFDRTPGLSELAARFAEAARLGADVAKLAVMPRDAADVLVLLQATLDASRTLPVPVVSMSMGGLGALTRISGAVFGSAMTFAIAGAASAPGQLPVADARAAMELLGRGLPR